MKPATEAMYRYRLAKPESTRYSRKPLSALWKSITCDILASVAGNGNGNGRKNRRVIPGLSPESLLGGVAKRIYAAALAQGRSQEQVPSLGDLAPLAELGLHLSAEQQAEYFATYNILGRLFGLSPAAIELLLLTLAMDLDERVYLAAVNLTASGIGAPGPRVGGALSLLYSDLAERSVAQQALRDESPLLAFRLLRILSPTKNAPLSQRELCAEPGLLPHVLKGELPPLQQLAGVGNLYGPADLDALDGSLPADLGHRLDLLLAAQGTTRALHLHLGSSRSGPSVARRVAAYLDRPVVLLDLRAVDDDHEDKVAITLREARLRNGLPFFLNPMSLNKKDDEYSPQLVRQFGQQWRRMLAHEPHLVLLGSEEPETRDVGTLASVGLDLAVHKLSSTTLHERRELFEVALAGVCEDQPGGVPQLSIASDVSNEYLASVYRVNEAEVRAIVSAASQDARLRALTEKQTPAITIGDLRHAAREKTHRDVGKFATLVESKYTWDDLVLPDDIKPMLLDICNSAKRRALVYEEWGYADKHARGLGLCSVFSGESGTGKTMSAEVIANELGVNMYQVNISTVVSKWLGETERHLAQIFDATENSDSILFFDEADALFGKRTEVNESKDRYANVEISYLLQRIEQYSGIVILSTNLRSNMDEAFLRRLQFGVQFPMPEVNGRRGDLEARLPDPGAQGRDRLRLPRRGVRRAVGRPDQAHRHGRVTAGRRREQQAQHGIHPPRLCQRAGQDAARGAGGGRCSQEVEPRRPALRQQAPSEVAVGAERRRAWRVKSSPWRPIRSRCFTSSPP